MTEPEREPDDGQTTPPTPAPTVPDPELPPPGGASPGSE